MNPIFEVGQTYRTRGGWNALIIYRLSEGGLVAVHRGPLGETSAEHRHDGQYLEKNQSSWDLLPHIAEVSA